MYFLVAEEMLLILRTEAIFVMIFVKFVPLCSIILHYVHYICI